MGNLVKKILKSQDIKMGGIFQMFPGGDMPCGVCVVELNRKLCILETNEYFFNNLVGGIDSVIGKSFLDLVGDETKNDLIDLDRELEEYKEVVKALKIKIKNGNDISVFVIAGYYEDTSDVEDVKKYGIFFVFDNNSVTVLQKNMVGILYAMQDGVVCYRYMNDDSALNSKSHVLRFANDEFYKIIGHTRKQFAALNNEIANILDIEGRNRAYNIVLKAMSNQGKKVKTEFTIKTYDGRRVYVICSLFSVPINDGTNYLIGCFRNVTQNKKIVSKVEDKLYIQSERYKLIEELTDELFFDYDAVKDVVELSYKFMQKFGVGNKLPHFLENEKIQKICHVEDYENAVKTIQEAAKELKKGSFEIRLLNQNKEYEWYNIKFSSVTNRNGEVNRVVGKMIDINEEKTSKQKMELQLQMDPMSGLYNKTAIRHICDEFFKSSLKKDKKISHAVIVIDIDNFKKINDTLGHAFGDLVIENIAIGIKSVLRVSDVAGRIGGDEFLVLLKDVNYDTALMKAEEIRKVISSIYAGEYKSIKTSACIGVSMFGMDGTDYDTLYSKADTAMYFSKKNGKNSVTLYTEALMKEKESIFDEDNKKAVVSKDYDEDFVKFAFNILTNSKDLDSSINILLERIGNRFDLTDIVILEHDSKHNTLVETNHWNTDVGIWKEKNVTRVDDYSKWDGFKNSFDDRGVLVFEDCMYGSDVSESDQLVFRDRGIKSLMYFGFAERIVDCDGYIACYDYSKIRRWTEYEIETIYQFTKIFSIFISIRKKRKQDEQLIKRLTMYDRFTNTLTITTFEEAYGKEMAEFDSSKYYAICYSDIDDFSYANDNFGYEAGDELLKGYADILINNKAGKFVCRIYSDYFIVLYMTNSKEELIDILEKNKKDFLEQQRKIYPQNDFNLSAGVYEINDNTCDISIAIDNANLARKKAKDKKDIICYFYDESLRNLRNDEQYIMTSINRAIKEKALVVYMQPKMNIVEDKIVGAETLVRWSNYNGRMRFPDEFIPVLEKIGYIVEMDFYVLEETLSNMKKWKDEGREPIVVSVNFSRRHNLYPNFVDRIFMLVKKYEIEPKYLQIEVTESCVADDSKQMLSNLRSLRGLGFSVAMDDFGTGYSSLSLLHSAPVDVVKIDRSFLKKYSEGLMTKDYILKICELIKTTGKEVLFEGLETEEQKQFLIENGCNVAQGYYYDKPLCLEEFEKKYL